MTRKPVIRIAAGLASLGLTLFALGCDFDPTEYFSRNACDFLNCDVLFFVDDILPLSGGPIAAGGDAPIDAGAAEEEDDGHAH